MLDKKIKQIRMFELLETCLYISLTIMLYLFIWMN